jgi:hypothetical protein
MSQITITTKTELDEALKNKNVNKIRVEGPLAKEMIAKAKKKNIIGGSLLAGTLIIAGALIAAPITGGTSLIAGAAGFTATAFTAGTVTITTAELAILIGGSVASLAILKGYGKIKINPDGSVEIVKN